MNLIDQTSALDRLYSCALDINTVSQQNQCIQLWETNRKRNRFHCIDRTLSCCELRKIPCLNGVKQISVHFLVGKKLNNYRLLFQGKQELLFCWMFWSFCLLLDSNSWDSDREQRWGNWQLIKLPGWILLDILFMIRKIHYKCCEWLFCVMV